MSIETEQPTATVIIVADHGATRDQVHQDLRLCFAGLAAQEFDEPVEYLFVESSENLPALPPDLLSIVPGLRVLPVESPHSYDLKNAGVRAARAEIVALIDGNCTPEPGWLRAAVENLRTHPEAAAVTGRTVYPRGGLVNRILALLSRAHEDRGRVRRARFISNANGAYRRDVFRAFPLRAEVGPFSALMQSEAMWRQGYRVHFEPAMQVCHAFEGWPTERDMRHQMGHATIRVRQFDREMRFAWMVRLGVLSVVPFFVLRTLDSWWNCLRSARVYGIRWWELPAALGLAVASHSLEVPGMVRALRGLPAAPSKYR